MKKLSLHIYALTLLPFLLISQDFNDDAAVWIGLKVEKKITKPFTVYLKHQSRINDNLNSYGLGYFDLGLSYKLNKHIKFIGGAVVSRKDPFYELYENRQRFYLSINLKLDVKKIELSYRNQAQIQIEHQKGTEYEIYDRNKFSCAYEINKRMSASVSEEIYLPLNYRDELFIDRARSTFSIIYKLDKKQSLEPYFLYQMRFVTSNNRDFVYGVNYTFSF